MQRALAQAARYGRQIAEIDKVPSDKTRAYWRLNVWNSWQSFCNQFKGNARVQMLDAYLKAYFSVMGGRYNG
jgi:hypothetical protein